jgi:hypothetical protein
MPDGRLGERTGVPADRRDARFASRRVVAVDERGERIEGDVLGEREADGQAAGTNGNASPELVVDGAEDRPVQRVDGEAGGAPARAARERLAEHGDV